MAEICCGVVSRGEPAVAVTVTDSRETVSRTARRRRIEFERFKFVAGVDSLAQSSEGNRKRQKMELTTPIKEVASKTQEDESCCVLDSRAYSGTEAGEVAICPSFESVDEARSASTEAAVALLNECPTYGVMSVCGRRRDMEDTLSVHPDLLQRFDRIPERYHFFGVYDGHGCSHVAVSCKERMHKIVAEELDRLESNPSTSLDWQSLMETSFFSMDAEAATRRRGPEIPACRCEFQTPKCDHVGSTAVVAVVSGEHIIVANCGDSRAVLCRNGSPVSLSDDHKPDRPDELRRIEDAGGRVIYWDGARVLGVLAMSRAIGDNYLKPFVISKPEVTVTTRGEGDDCLILASDGLWDVVTNETACQIVRMVLRGSGLPVGDPSRPSSDKACADAAMLLTKLALARQSADNVSVVVVDLRRQF
ncbi:protein phosphatase 2C 37-like [Phalaenopsis equestris]|uniref:protein phosphatase 2C 37-like n=1 Tax=Phalaenopsis equestris TaxID=78828 RepID=UPI0009E47FCD|nr:protein phosphatase 2C 37-like [Phalaenopsis equestris]